MKKAPENRGLWNSCDNFAFALARAENYVEQISPKAANGLLCLNLLRHDNNPLTAGEEGTMPPTESDG